MQRVSTSGRWARGAALAAVFAGVVLAQSLADRKPVKPGFNLFSKQQDVQLGQEAVAQIEQEVEVVNDRELTAWLDRIGQKLAKNSQDPDYPFTFKVIADPNINAFALPGGPIYMNSGLIAQADNEAQVAGVVGHEIGHVVLRHSTNQASRASLLQLPAILAASATGNGGLLGSLAQVGIGLGLNSTLLKYSRNAERDSDIVGARMLALSGYNPVEMATFFEKLSQLGGRGGPEFLSSHPSPGNRVQAVNKEIAGYRHASGYVTDTPEFARMKARAAAIKPTRQPNQQQGSSSAQGGGKPSAPEVVQGAFQGQGFRFEPPKGWRASRHGSGATIVPDNGLAGNGIARGMVADYFTQEARNQKDAVDKFLADLKAKNNGFAEVQGQRRSMRFGGVAGESVFIEGPSPIQGKREYLWIVAAQRPQGLFHLIMIAPTDEYNNMSKTFEGAVRSIRFE